MTHFSLQEIEQIQERLLFEATSGEQIVYICHISQDLKIEDFKVKVETLADWAIENAFLENWVYPNVFTFLNQNFDTANIVGLWWSNLAFLKICLLDLYKQHLYGEQ